MIITQELLEEGKSSRGAWSNKQLKTLGLPESWINPKDGGLRKGWKQFLLGSQVSEKNAQAFIDLKDKHLKPKHLQRHSEKDLFHNTKAERQAWWANLPEVEKQQYLQKKLDQKAAANRKRSIAIMEDHKGEYSCQDCIHGLTKSCTDNLPDGCEQWANPSLAKKGLLDLHPNLYNLYKKSKLLNAKTTIILRKVFGTNERVEKNPKALVFKAPRHTH